MLHHDRITNAHARSVGEATLFAVSQTQGYDNATQVLGLAGAFVLLCERLGVRPATAIDIIAQMRRDAETSAPFRAAQMYMKYEIKERQ